MSEMASGSGTRGTPVISQHDARKEWPNSTEDHNATGEVDWHDLNPQLPQEWCNNLSMTWSAGTNGDMKPQPRKFYGGKSTMPGNVTDDVQQIKTGAMVTSGQMMHLVMATIIEVTSQSQFVCF
ncbi:hypothetical protein LTS08_006284 [Lithohypha guttulata]|nr:hypothetical protein LTS08_006284 [Lithohypha guttulata]